MQVHMRRKRLTPRVQSRQQTRPGPEELGIVKQLDQRLGRRREECCRKQCLVVNATAARVPVES